MKTFKKCLIAILVISIPYISSAQMTNKGQLNVYVNGVTNQEESLRILLFNNKDVFPYNEQYAFLSVTKNLDQIEKPTKFNIPFGEYAVFVYHDSNGNGKHDRNFFGKPSESQGFSILNSEQIDKPDFAECVFTFNQDAQTVTIDMGQIDNHVTTK